MDVWDVVDRDKKEDDDSGDEKAAPRMIFKNSKIKSKVDTN
jgi:hypothetical protein